MITLQVLEHSTLKVNEETFKKRHLALLHNFKQKHKTSFFTVGYNYVKFHHYVGVLKVGNLFIEILPKIDRHQNDTALLKNVLIQLLKAAGAIKIHTLPQTQLQQQQLPLLDIFVEQFINEVEQLYFKGLVKKYIRQRANQTALKGRLIFSENIKRNLIHKEHFFVEFSDYNYDNIYNQIIYKALTISQNITSNPHLRQRIAGLLLILPPVSNKKITEKHFARLTFNRQTEKYKNAIALAKLIVLNYSPDLTAGIDNVFGLLFDMNQLFELYIYKQLKKLNDENLKVKYQTSKIFWKGIKIRPDIVIEKDGQTIIIDTKWKMLQKIEPSMDDLRQMFVYTKYWNAKKALLLYPQHQNLADSNFISYNESKESNASLKVAFVNLLTDNGLNSNIGKEILEKLEE